MTALSQEQIESALALIHQLEVGRRITPYEADDLRRPYRIMAAQQITEAYAQEQTANPLVNGAPVLLGDVGIESKLDS